MEVKQVIVVRKDLKMRRGKEIAQSCHASIAWLTSMIRDEKDSDMSLRSLWNSVLSIPEREWLESSFRKVTLQVDSEVQLLAIYETCKLSGLEVHLITDNGLTEFDGVPTNTCIAIGPDYDEKIDLITGPEGKFPLKLY